MGKLFKTHDTSEIYDCTVCGNVSDVDGGAINSGSYCYNSIVWGNFDREGNICNWEWYQYGIYVYTPAFSYSCTFPEGFDDCGGCTTEDPRFVDAAHGDYRLAADSPCIDAGYNDLVYVDRDLDGTNRIFGAWVDMGCYEYCRTILGWPVPEVTTGASGEAEAAAVAEAMKEAGFEEGRATALTRVAQYNALSAWAADHGLGVSDLVASSAAFISPALAASGLLNLRSEDLEIVGFSPGWFDRTWVLKLNLRPYNPSTVNAALLKAAVGVVGSETPNGRFSADEIRFSVSPRLDSIRVSVMPPNGKRAYFLKGVIR